MSKYRSKQIESEDGNFDSLKEYRRWEELKQMQDKGEITKLERQVRINLLPPQRHRNGTCERGLYYVADFSYYKDGEKHWEDVKPTYRSESAERRYKSTAAYRTFAIKRKLALCLKGIDIEEV